MTHSTRLVAFAVSCLLVACAAPEPSDAESEITQAETVTCAPVYSATVEICTPPTDSYGLCSCSGEFGTMFTAVATHERQCPTSVPGSSPREKATCTFQRATTVEQACRLAEQGADVPGLGGNLSCPPGCIVGAFEVFTPPRNYTDGKNCCSRRARLDCKAPEATQVIAEQ